MIQALKPLADEIKILGEYKSGMQSFNQIHSFKMKPADRINQVQEYYFSKKLAEVKQMQDQGKDIINLGIGSPDLPPHPEVIKELKSKQLSGR